MQGNKGESYGTKWDELSEKFRVEEGDTDNTEKVVIRETGAEVTNTNYKNYKSERKEFT